MAARPPELVAWQVRALEAFARSPLSAEATFGGATALSAVYLHHRRSEDLDFFFFREVEAAELTPLIRVLKRAKYTVEQRAIGPRRTLVLSARGREIGHIDFAYYPYPPIGRLTRWMDLRVDSLVDMTVNKIQAVLTRARPRDFVDLHFLLHEGPERDLEKLVGLARAKFDAGPSTITVAEALLRVEEITELPELIRPLALADIQEYFVGIARDLVRKGPGKK